VVTIGVMGWTGVRLDLTTVLLAPLLLGIVVDDTVHVMERVLGARQAGATVEDAFRESVVEVGHAVVLTSITLACGFLIPIFGSFKPNLAFALLSVLAISLALVADLIVFPAISSLWPSLVPGVGPNLSPSNSDRYARSDAS
jgi:predicted RND superfamily exporter protein